LPLTGCGRGWSECGLVGGKSVACQAASSLLPPTAHLHVPTLGGLHCRQLLLLASRLHHATPASQVQPGLEGRGKVRKRFSSATTFAGKSTAGGTSGGDHSLEAGTSLGRATFEQEPQRAASNIRTTQRAHTEGRPKRDETGRSCAQATLTDTLPLSSRLRRCGSRRRPCKGRKCSGQGSV